MYGSDTSGGLALSAWSVTPRDTSVTTPRKRMLLPWMLTKAPTLTSSTDLPGSNLTSTPSVREPATTMPRFLSSPSNSVEKVLTVIAS